MVLFIRLVLKCNVGKDYFEPHIYEVSEAYMGRKYKHPFLWGIWA